MTSDAKKLSKSIRALRARLLSDLREATQEAYKLSLPAEKSNFTERARERRRRLDAWIEEQTRSEPRTSAPKWHCVCGARWRRTPPSRCSCASPLCA